MQFLLGIQDTKTQENKKFVSDITSALSKTTTNITKGHSYSSMLSYAAVDKYDAIWLDWQILVNNFSDFCKRLFRINKQIPIIIFSEDSQISGELCTNSDLLFAVIPRNTAQENIPKIIKRIQKFNTLIKNASDRVRPYLKPIGFDKFIGNADLSLLVYQQLIKVSQTDFTTLILGGSGSGKELAAQTIHKFSFRNKQNMVSLNCAAIPATLQESELFGYEKGAFTGAERTRAGKFELANDGTLFLDEVGDMPLDLQAKLLRVLEDSTFSKVGSVKEQKVDVRFIAATNRGLSNMVSKGDFRSDLFYRLNVIPIDLPQLSARDDDIVLLILNLIGKMISSSSIKVKTISWALINNLKELKINGNVRELENILTRILFHTSGSVINENVLKKINLIEGQAISYEQDGKDSKGLLALWEVEKDMIEKALDIYPHNLSKIASKLEISRSSLYRKLKKYELQE
ncbi:MAG: sigma-54 dependent transcriptional regulator [Candidatus Neomarinimicrobiota bacterium]